MSSKVQVVFVFYVVILFTACSKKGPAVDGERWCEIEKEIEVAKAQSNIERVRELKQQRRVLHQELEERYKNDEKGTDELDMAFESCMRAFRQNNEK